jgi:hypothetical protein
MYHQNEASDGKRIVEPHVLANLSPTSLASKAHICAEPFAIFQPQKQLKVMCFLRDQHRAGAFA